MKTFNLNIEALVLSFILLFTLTPLYSQNSFIDKLYPEVNSINAKMSSDIVIKFAHEIDQSSLNSSSIKIYGSESGILDAIITYNTSNREAYINPVKNFRAGEKISVTLLNNIKTSSFGNIDPYSYSFKVNPSGGTAYFSDTAISFAGSGSLTNIKTGDFDRDGDLDLCVICKVSSNFHKLVILKNDGSGHFPDTSNIVSIDANVYWVNKGFLFTGDYDLDGDIDIALGQYPVSSFGSWELNIFNNSGTGNFTHFSTFSFYYDSEYDMDQGDINNDGFLDFIILKGDLLLLFINNGSGSFYYNRSLWVGCQRFLTNGSMTVNDFDNDGDQDIFAGGAYRDEGIPACNKSVMCINTGYLNFSLYNITPPYNSRYLISDDMDNDRKIDLLMIPERILLFRNPYTFRDIEYPPAGYTILTGNFDGDADLDIAEPGPDNHSPVIHYNDGYGNFSTNTSPLMSGVADESFSSGDFDNDGDIDIIKTGPTSGYLTVFKNFASCVIEGPSIINTESTMILYSCSENDGFWKIENSVTCNASISGDNTNDTVYINSGSTGGYFSLKFYGIDSVMHCSKVISVDNPFPVELTGFTSLTTGRNITLNWTTSSELNNSGFEIEKRNAGNVTSDNWLKAGFVNGSGTISEPANYTFTDKNLSSGKYKYRLKQIDFNGNFEYFELAEEVSIGIPERFELSQNYPNPFNPVTNLEFGISRLGFVSLKIYDITGREMVTLVNEVKEPGYYNIKFNASNLSSGVYFYRLVVSSSNSMTAGDFVAVKKMVVLK